MDGALREDLLARFCAYLDDLGDDSQDATPDATAGPDPDPDRAGRLPDLYTLLAELCSLKNEVRLESRQVKTALDQFRDAFDLVRTAQERLAEGESQRAESERRARTAAERDLIMELLELRDRLQAGHDQARRYRPNWLARRGGADGFVTGMAEGLAMNLRRLDETLARRGVRALPVLGTRFDPQTMHAGEVGRDPTQPDGTVLAELRRGFVQGERLLRAAEVSVNRVASGQEERAKGQGPRAEDG
jgi:molecular chaperone GrpE